MHATALGNEPSRSAEIAVAFFLFLVASDCNCERVCFVLFSCLGFFCPVMSSSSGSSQFPSGPEFFHLLGLPNESALLDSWANQAPADASAFVGELEAQFGMSVSIKNKARIPN